MRELEVEDLVSIIQEFYFNFLLSEVKAVHRINSPALVVEEVIDGTTVKLEFPLITYGRYVFSYNPQYQVLGIGYADELNKL